MIDDDYEYQSTLFEFGVENPEEEYDNYPLIMQDQKRRENVPKSPKNGTENR